MDMIIKLIVEYCNVVGINLISVHYVPDTEYILIVLNDQYIGTDATDVVFNGIESIFKKNGVEIDE